MRLICGCGYFCRPSLPPLSLTLVTVIRRLVYVSLSMSDISSTSSVYIILITLRLFIHSLLISSVYLSLYLYLYTDYYSVYRTFICIAHLPFQLLSFRNLWGAYKLEFVERKLWSVISVYWTGPTSQFWLMARTLYLTSYALSWSQNDKTSSIW